MSSISLVIHQISVRQGRSRTPCDVANFNGGEDLLEYFEAYLGERQTANWRSGDTKRVMKVDKTVSQGRYLSGIMRSGDYGFEADLVNVKKGSVDYKRREDQAELLPFYFLIHVPKDGRIAFSVTQRFGLVGAFGCFEEDFVGFFRRNCTDYNVKFEVAIPEEMVQEFLETGEITRIRFVGHTVPKAVEDMIRQDSRKGLMSELVIRASRNKPLGLKQALLNVIRGRQDIKSFITLPDFPYDSVKVEFQSGRKRKTMRLTDLLQIRPEIDVSDQITLKRGHPTYESVDEIARDWLDKLLKSLESEVSDAVKD